MADHSNRMSGRYLPSLHAVTGPLFKCSHCTTYAVGPEELKYHELSCHGQVYPVPVRKQPSLAAQQTNQFPSQPYRLQTQFESHSSPSSGAEDSDGSSVVMTPVSREASLCPYPTTRRQSGVVRTEKGRGRRSTAATNQQDDAARRTKKMNKEKWNRGQHGAVIYRFEDFTGCYTGWSRQEQSGGNGNGAGLQANKITNLMAMERCAYIYLHEGRTRALEEGRVAEWQAEMHAILDSASSSDHHPYDGTFAGGEPVDCYHEDKAKACKAHNHDDWRECRVSRVRQRFGKNEKEWVNSRWAQMKQQQQVKSLPMRPGSGFPRGQ